MYTTTLVAASPEAADRHYARAIELVREKRLAEAKLEFEAAYRESPHFVVLYNLGRVSLELGQYPEARDYLRRCLVEGDNSMSETQRADTQDLLRRALENQPPPEVALTEEAPVAAPSANLPVPSVARETSAKVPTPPIGKAAIAARVSAPPATPTPSEQRWTYALGGGGVSALLVAGTLFLWNADAHAEAKSDRERLMRSPGPDAVRAGDAAAFEAALAHERKLADNDADFRAIRRMDTVVLVTAAVGVTLCVASAIAYLASPRRASGFKTIHQPNLRLSF